MFKDYGKYLSASLRVYLLVLIIIFIMKLVGLDYFGLDISNPVMLKLNNTLTYLKIDNLYQILCLYLNFYLVESIIFKDNSFTKSKIIIPTIIIVSMLALKFTNNLNYYPLLNTSIMFIYFLIRKVKIKRIIYVFGINIIVQLINLYVRNYNPEGYDILANSIMNIDYYIMLLIWYELIVGGGNKLCQEVYSFSQMKVSLKKLQTKLQENLHNFKELDKVSKLTFIIYFILSLFWNTLTLVIILLVARLNDTLIECIFILTSFWLSKRIFGKAFHLQSMAQCFIVSNLTYYTLNRITSPLGISILIPIMLGVGLSYFTSKLVKKSYKPLYKGMPKEVFEETILKVVDKDSDKYKICYDYFINKKNALYLAGKYNYTEAGIRKIKDRVNNKIKGLQ